MAGSRKSRSSAPKGRMQLYDVRVVDIQTGEITDERCLDCSCWLFSHWWQGNWRDAQGKPFGPAARIEITPR